MVLSGGDRLVLGALRPVPGSARLVALRFLLVTLSSLPALVGVAAKLASGAAVEPYFTEIGGRLPIAPLGRLMGSVSPALGIAMLLCAAIAVLGDQALTGGALTLLAPDRGPVGRAGVFATVRREGAIHFWPFARLLLAALLLSGAGIAAIRMLFTALDRMGEREGWTGATRVVALPFASVGLILFWLATVGAWFFWCRVLTVADGRRLARRTGPLALRVFWRQPMRSWLFFVVVTLGSTLASGAVLAAWLQSEPKGGAGVLAWSLGWLLTLWVQAFIWHWLVRSGSMLYASGSLEDLRLRPDAPFRLPSRMLRRLRGRRGPGQGGVDPACEGAAPGGGVAHPE